MLSSGCSRTDLLQICNVTSFKSVYGSFTATTIKVQSCPKKIQTRVSTRWRFRDISRPPRSEIFQAVSFADESPRLNLALVIRVQEVDRRKGKRKGYGEQGIRRALPRENFAREADYVRGRAAAKKIPAESPRAKERAETRREKKGKEQRRARYDPARDIRWRSKARVKRCTTPPYPSRMPMRNRTRPRTRVRVRARCMITSLSWPSAVYPVSVMRCAMPAVRACTHVRTFQPAG